MKKIIIFLFLTFNAHILFSSVVFAETSKEPIKRLVLDAIVISAERPKLNYQTGDVDTYQTPAFFSVIQRDMFEGKIKDLSEVIEKEVGLQVRETGGLGSFSTVSLRGSSGDQVMVFWDGILLNDASGGGVDLNMISLSDVESIEIFRGITPLNFGNASIGGAVNIRTLRSHEGLKTIFQTGCGSFNTRKISGFINNKPGRGDYLISGDYLFSDNDFPFLNDKGTEWNKEDDIWQKRNNAQIDQKNVLCKLGFDFTDDVRGDLVHQWFSKNQGLPSWNNSEKTGTSLNTRRNISTLKFTFDNIGPYNFNILTSLSHLLKEEEYDDRQGHIGLGKQHSKYITRREEGHFYLDWLTKKNTANFLFNVQHEEYKIKDFLKKTNPNKSVRDTFSLGLQDSLSLFNYSLIITPAFRYTFIQDELKSALSIKGFPLEGLSRKRNYPSPQIGLKYSPHQWCTLKTNIARCTRVPSFFELFGDRGFFLGNEDLKTEKGINFDVGVEINYPTSNEMLKKILFKAAYFSNQADDLITRVYDARGVGKSVNISQAKIEGFEAVLNLYFFKMMRFVGNATWQDTKNLHQIKAFNLKKLPGKFETSYMGKIEVLYRIFKLYCEKKIEKNIYYDTANLLKAEDKREINAGISLLYHSFVFNFEAKNLGNERYEDFNGYPLPGRSYYCELKYTFR